MNISIQAPPALTGNNTQDILQLREWCNALYSRLKYTLYMLDGENIRAIPPEKLSGGTINADTINISGTLMKLSGTQFEISTPDGSQYIRCADGKLTISAESVISNDE